VRSAGGRSSSNVNVAAIACSSVDPYDQDVSTLATATDTHRGRWYACVALVPSTTIALVWAAAHGEDVWVLADVGWIVALWAAATRLAEPLRA
jgi:hypothetical protein